MTCDLVIPWSTKRRVDLFASTRHLFAALAGTCLGAAKAAHERPGGCWRRTPQQLRHWQRRLASAPLQYGRRRLVACATRPAAACCWLRTQSGTQHAQQQQPRRQRRRGRCCAAGAGGSVHPSVHFQDTHRAPAACSTAASAARAASAAAAQPTCTGAAHARVPARAGGGGGGGEAPPAYGAAHRPHQITNGSGSETPLQMSIACRSQAAPEAAATAQVPAAPAACRTPVRAHALKPTRCKKPARPQTPDSPISAPSRIHHVPTSLHCSTCFSRVPRARPPLPPPPPLSTPPPTGLVRAALERHTRALLVCILVDVITLCRTCYSVTWHEQREERHRVGQRRAVRALQALTVKISLRPLSISALAPSALLSAAQSCPSSAYRVAPAGGPSRGPRSRRCHRQRALQVGCHGGRPARD